MRRNFKSQRTKKYYSSQHSYKKVDPVALQARQSKTELSRELYEIEDNIFSCLPYDNNFFKVPPCTEPVTEVEAILQSTIGQMVTLTAPFFLNEKPLFVRIMNTIYFPSTAGVTQGAQAAMRSLKEAQRSIGKQKEKSITSLRKAWNPYKSTNEFVHGFMDAEMMKGDLPYQDNRLILHFMIKQLSSSMYDAFGLVSEVIGYHTTYPYQIFADFCLAWWTYGRDKEHLDPDSMLDILNLMHGAVDIDDVTEAVATKLIEFINVSFQWAFNHFDPRLVYLCGASNFNPSGAGWGVLSKVRKEKQKRVKGDNSITLSGVFVTSWKEVVNREEWVRLIDKANTEYEALASSQVVPNDARLALLEEIKDFLSAEISNTDKAMVERLNRIIDKQLDQNVQTTMVRELKKDDYTVGMLEIIYTNGVTACDNKYPAYLEAFRLDERKEELGDVFTQLRQIKQDKIHKHLLEKNKNIGATAFISQGIDL